jgi:uncharacterized membrane-anchored protein
VAKTLLRILVRSQDKLVSIGQSMKEKTGDRSEEELINMTECESAPQFFT